MNAFRLITFTCVVSSIANISCQPIKNQKDDLELKHTTNNPTQGDSPFLWHKLSDTDIADFRTGLIPNGRDGNILPSEHILAKRLQTWTDLIHRAWGKALPATTPKPRVIVIQSQESQAWVTWLPVCLDAAIEVRVPGASGNVDYGSFESDTLESGDGNFPGMGGNPHAAKCAVDDQLSSKTTDFVNFYNGFYKDKKRPCTLSLVGKTIVVTGDTCTTHQSDKKLFAKAKHAMFRTTASAFLITTALLSEVEHEDEAIGLSSPGKFSGYFYGA